MAILALGLLLVLSILFFVVSMVALFSWVGVDGVELMRMLNANDSEHRPTASRAMFYTKLIEKTKLLARRGCLLLDRIESLAMEVGKASELQVVLDQSKQLKSAFRIVGETTRYSPEGVSFSYFYLKENLSQDMPGAEQCASLAREWLEFVGEWNTFYRLYHYLIRWHPMLRARGGERMKIVMPEV